MNIVSFSCARLLISERLKIQVKDEFQWKGNKACHSFKKIGFGVFFPLVEKHEVYKGKSSSWVLDMDTESMLFPGALWEFKEFGDAEWLLDQWMQQFHTKELLVSHLTFLFVSENMLLTLREANQSCFTHKIVLISVITKFEINSNKKYIFFILEKF